MSYYRLTAFMLLTTLTWIWVRAVDVRSLPTTRQGSYHMLDNLLDDSRSYRQTRMQRVDSLKDAVAGALPERRFRIFDSLAQLYESVQLDSAVAYRKRASQIAFELGDSAEGYLQKARSCVSLADMGVASHAIDVFETIPTEGFSREQLVRYYETGARIFGLIGMSYPVENDKNLFISQALEYTDSLIEMAGETDPVRQIALAHRYYSEGKKAMVVGSLTSVLSGVSPSSPIYGEAARMLGRFYRQQGKTEDAIFYLSLAVISELMTGSSGNQSLMTLAEVLYDSGDVRRAYACMRLALDNSVKSGAKMHSVEAAEHVPMIADAFREQDHREMTLLITLSCFLVGLLVIIVAILIFLRKEMRSINMMREKVMEANQMKETYISHFMNLCSIYLEKLDEFSRMARRKIAAGQVDDLYEMIRSGKIMDEQSRIFYEKFDMAFNHIFPDFVAEVNKLLQPDKQVPLPTDGKLTTELRILAFGRLGIDDAAQIARFLGLSLNTIYTYRNKMRSKAISRATFETDIMQIGKII